ncbi:BTAD domain-containing putative transcriptional regulator [Streptomyces canus]|uniref:BTAD domain-containing putative transcriptional regulator n=1 Tax=Streptomyces canus TaxID=58343 RepID=UPI003865B84A
MWSPMWIKPTVDRDRSRRRSDPAPAGHVGEHPLRERGVALLMSALHGEGRSHDAQAVYARLVRGRPGPLSPDPLRDPQRHGGGPRSQG